MNKAYLYLDLKFETLTRLATKLLGNSIVFMIAFCLVIYWWGTNLFTSNDHHQNIGDFIFGFTFLSLFIIQKSFNKYSALVHLKMNELISSNELANNSVLNTHQKTEKEIREYRDLETDIEKVLDDAQKEITKENLK
jgi:low affinity Fe/Cu permease